MPYSFGKVASGRDVFPGLKVAAAFLINLIARTSARWESMARLTFSGHPAPQPSSHGNRPFSTPGSFRALFRFFTAAARDRRMAA